MKLRSSITISLLFSNFALADSLTHFAFINGGYDTVYNYSAHEEDLLAFRNGLFKSADTSHIRLLNAAGKNSRILEILPDNTFSRDASGWIKSAKSRVTEPTQPATLENINQLFDEIKDAKRVTLVYGDHGDSGGIVTWGGRRLSPQQTRQNLTKFSADALVRSIHLHCYAGAALVDPKRTKPTEVDSLEKYFNEYYPLNRCGVGLANEYEVGQYYNYNKSWKDGPWTKLFSQKPELSLKDIKNQLVQDSEFSPVPRLTSDYLITDTVQIFCSLKNLPAAGSKASESKTCGKAIVKNSRFVVESIPILESYLCNATQLDQEISKIEKQYQAATAEADNVSRIVSHWGNQYIKAHLPKFYEEYRKTSAAVEKLKASLTRQGLSKKEEQTILRQIEAIGATFPASYERAILTLDFQPDESFKKFIAGNCTESEFVCSDPKEARNIALTKANDLQKSRKDLILRQESERLSMAKLIFELPGFESAKKAYENISNCENSRLN